MGFMRRQGDASHRVRKEAAKNDHGALEPDQRLVIAVMAIGMILGALMTPSKESPNSHTAPALNASATR
jgi:hypothetical protein